MEFIALIVVYTALFGHDSKADIKRDMHRRAEQKCAGPESYQLLDRPVIGEDNQLTYILCKKQTPK